MVVAVVFSTHPRFARGASLVPYRAMLDAPHEVVRLLAHPRPKA